jgi:signal transduction histidine kinase
LGTIFSRFGRASNARRKGISGSGVGLYVSRKIVETHGGSIAVQSSEGQGSTFTVTLPLSRTAAEQPSL